MCPKSVSGGFATSRTRIHDRKKYTFRFGLCSQNHIDLQFAQYLMQMVLKQLRASISQIVHTIQRITNF